MASTPDIDLASIPGLEDVAQELSTLLHCAKNPGFRVDDKVVRCLKLQIQLAVKKAEVDAYDRAIALVNQNVDSGIKEGLKVLRRHLEGPRCPR